MGLRVNISDKESEVKSFEPIPRGVYHVKVTDGEMAECGPGSKNPGKPYWKLEFTTQDGKYENRKIWTNVMLFDGALYSLVNICKAIGIDVEAGEFEVPDLDDIIGQDMYVRVSITPANDNYDARNEVKSYKPFDGKVASEGQSVLLP